MPSKITLTDNNLTIETLKQVVLHGAKIDISKKCQTKIKKAEKYIHDAAEKNEVYYGVTTGFGSLCDKFIPNDKAKQLQHNILESHSVGVGEPLVSTTVRAIMLLRIYTLVQGFSGARLKTVNTFIEMLNKGVYPIIPQQGSVGASGDLCPLAHMSLPLIGKGKAEYQGKVMSGAKAMEKAKIKTLTLTYKEGLSLTNGTQVMTAVGILTLVDAIEIIKHADLACAISKEALCGKKDAFDARVHKLRPYKGQVETAQNIRNIIKGSKLIDIMRYDVFNGEKHERKIDVQDSYSIRCAPQVHGASRNALYHVNEILDIEACAITDNPHIFPDENKIMSAGNFHGQPVALAMDYMKLAIAEIGNISERRTAKLVDKNHNLGLPAFLTKNPGLNSGLMLPQYTAASLVSENKVLVHPASADSIPTCGNQEDHVSMGTIGARQAREILGNVRNILAIELLTAAQALELRMEETGKKPGKGTMAAFKAIRKNVPFISQDGIMYDHIYKMADMIASGEILDAVKKASVKLV